MSSTISGWGGYSKQTAEILNPLTQSEFINQLEKTNTTLARGMGRSYGDCANASVLMQTKFYDHFIAFDCSTGLLKLETGVLLRDILKVTVKRGWFLPVTPGTSFVTVGGAIASDVHGKNHHASGTFSRYVKSMSVLLGTGDVVTTSPSIMPDLFRATCGGMGLTGLILNATIQLMPISSVFIKQKTFKVGCIEEACEAFEGNSKVTYSVAWIDALALGKNLGRSVLMVAEHVDSGGLDLSITDPIKVPMVTPDTLLNNKSMWLFNNFYWLRTSHNKTQTLPMMSYFYPLDAIGEWNKLYGKAGFLQYQFVLPRIDGVVNIRRIIQIIAQSGQGSFLAVLKLFGPANDNLLSFPIEGYSLSLDFKLNSSTIPLLHELDEIVTGMGGRVYLAKDAVMYEHIFKKTYLNWELFEEVRENYGAIGKFASAQSKRIGLA